MPIPVLAAVWCGPEGIASLAKADADFGVEPAGGLTPPALALLRHNFAAFNEMLKHGVSLKLSGDFSSLVMFALASKDQEALQALLSTSYFASWKRTEIRDFQMALRSNGLLEGPADGQWRPETIVAIAAAQEYIGVEVTGIPDRELMQTLESIPSR
jgi:peptidoglycan hydrolase-like protein with peptidoglycan-binding domain